MFVDLVLFAVGLSDSMKCSEENKVFEDVCLLKKSHAREWRVMHLVG